MVFCVFLLCIAYYGVLAVCLLWLLELLGCLGFLWLIVCAVVGRV